MQIEKRAFVASERFAPAMQKLFAIASAIDLNVVRAETRWFCVYRRGV